MKVFRTKKHYGRIILISALFGLPLLIFLKIPLIYRIAILLLLIGITLLSTLDLRIDTEKISIKYPFLFFLDEVIINWESLKKVKVVYRSGLTHGAMMPSFIHFIGIERVKKVNYKLSREELQTVRNLVESKGIVFECKNSPYD